MKITFLKRSNKKLSEFKKHEWELVHLEHYGKKLDWNYWDVKKIRIKVEDNGKIVGGLAGHTMAGVFYIAELIVDHNERGAGIGKALMDKAVKYARKNNIHLLYLETGEDWRAVKFYEKLGFKKVTLLEKFFSKKNFWLMIKYL